jgi:hypothetical protein
MSEVKDIYDAKEIYYKTKLNLKNSQRDIEIERLRYETRKKYMAAEEIKIIFLRTLIVIIFGMIIYNIYDIMNK